MKNFKLISFCLLFSLFGSNVTASVWDDYKLEQKNNPQRVSEFQNRSLTFNGKTMKYAYSIIGQRPQNGYPLYIALHGGGGAPSSLNDSQWEHMKIYYKDSVKEGIYLAPRGVTDTWNLHFVNESYVLYDRLIENMILFEDVDPNRVYLLGFSAGGDGVYQIAPRMSDRFAAVNMSAGHPNGVSLLNCLNIPFLIQVGEIDGAYNRNKEAAKYCTQLNDFGYLNQCNIHFQKPHNFYDNDPNQTMQTVLRSPKEWLQSGDRSTVMRNTNAITWISNFNRNPLPSKVVWDLTTMSDRRGVDQQGNSLWNGYKRGEQNYWLDISKVKFNEEKSKIVEASFDLTNNQITVTKAISNLRILLSDKMVNLNKPIHLLIEGKSIDVSPIIDLTKFSEFQKLTIRERGDPNFIFDFALKIWKEEDHWLVTQE